MSQGEVWALARGEGNGVATDAEDAVRLAQEVARATLEEARVEAERIRAAALEEAAEIRAEARASAKAEAEADTARFEGALRAMEAEITTLSAQLVAIEGRRTAPEVLEAPAVEPAREPDVVRAAPALGELRRLLDSHARPVEQAGLEPEPEPTPVIASEPEPEPEPEPEVEPAIVAVEQPAPMPVPIPTPRSEPSPQQRLSPIPLEAVLPMLALVLLLIVVLAWLG